MHWLAGADLRVLVCAQGVSALTRSAWSDGLFVARLRAPGGGGGARTMPSRFGVARRSTVGRASSHVTFPSK